MIVIKPNWHVLVILAFGRLASSEAPYHPYSESASNSSDEVNRSGANDSATPPKSESAAREVLREAASFLKDSAKDTASEDALEEAALTEAAMQDDGLGDDQAKPQKPVPVPVRPHLRGQSPESRTNNRTEVNNSNKPAEMSKNMSSPTGAANLSTAASMEEAITDLMLGRASFGATPFGKSVEQITNLIEKDMMPKVLAAHTANQKELDNLIEQVRDCEATKNMGVAKADKKKAVYLKMSPLHKTCRSGEAGIHTEKVECNNELKDKRGLMNLKCKEFAFVYKKYGDQNANRQIVKKAGLEHTESYLKRITSTVCGKYPPGGLGGGGRDGFLDIYMRAKDACNRATKNYNLQKQRCTRIESEYRAKRKMCDNIQDQMDDSACKRAVNMKDACETYAECYYDKRKVFVGTEKMVRLEEKDRHAEWRGLKRMQCLMTSFDDGKVKASEIDSCKKRVYDVGHLVVKYPKVPKLVTCSVPLRYPSTAPYKLAEFAPLPANAKGRADANECTGVVEVSVTPHKKSPKTCKCERMTLNGPYTPGPLVRCSNCLEIRRSQDVSSCPVGTKLFSPRSASDWRTIFSSVGKLQDPYFIVDVTRPQNGCGGCTRKPMNSGKGGQGFYWHTSDGSPWWLRSSAYKEPSGNYLANCYMALHKPFKVDHLKFEDHQCKFSAKSYYCQLREVSTTPKRGSPPSCRCEKVALTGPYSAGALIKCESCWRVSKSTQKNSCPVGTKLFSPASARDWKTVLASAEPLRSPHWIIDVTRPQNGCGGCTRYPMNSKVAAQGTWRTSDGSPWWLRSTKYTEPNGNYYANCYMDLWKIPANENSVTFDDNKCKIHSNAYYCQPVRRR